MSRAGPAKILGLGYFQSEATRSSNYISPSATTTSDQQSHKSCPGTGYESLLHLFAPLLLDDVNHRYQINASLQ